MSIVFHEKLNGGAIHDGNGTVTAEIHALSSFCECVTIIVDDIHN